MTTVFLAVSISAARGDAPPTFERDIRPLFAKRCVVCHNRKALNDPDVSAGLALDSLEATLAGTGQKKVLVPGKASESPLFQRLNEPDDDKRMPLLDKPLPAPQRDLVRRWIDAGAPRGTAVGNRTVGAKPLPVRRIVRALDLVLPAEAKAPPKSDGFGPGGAIQLVLKVGPLPAISSLAFRGDGRQLAVGTHGAVVVWDLADARPALILHDVPGPAHALALSRDGRRLVVGAGLPARSGVVRVYSIPDGTLLHDFEGHDDVVFGLALRPDGAQLASASFDQTVRLWSLAPGRPDGVFHGHSDFVYDVAYTRDGQSLLTVSKDRMIKRIDVKTLKEKRTYSGSNEDVLALAIQPSGDKFVTAGNEPQLRWWTIESEAPVMQVGGHGGPVHQLAFSGNGKRLISAGGDASVRVWDGLSGALQRILPGPTEWQYTVALSDDGRLAAAGGWDGLVRVWDAESGQLRATLVQPPAVSGDRVEWLALVPSGFFTASPGLESLLRWRVGGSEVSRDRPFALFSNSVETARSLRGEPVNPPFVAKAK